MEENSLETLIPIDNEGQAVEATIVATVDEDAEDQRIMQLEQRLQAAEARLTALSAAGAPESGRKTSVTASMFAKSGEVPTLAANALDGALSTLSIEQRIAVKAELLRAGLIG